MTRIADTYCEIRVAHAAPATPMPSVFTNTTSSAIFKQHANSKYKNGRLLSPTASITPDPILYTSVPRTPKK